MTKLNQIYKCNVCGNIVEVTHIGVGELTCCGKSMQLILENTIDASKEKHVPVIEKSNSIIKVKVGSEPHPMEEKHFIEWVELLVDNKSYKQFLRPGDDPEVEFQVSGDSVEVRAYCNLHGLWKL